MAQVSISEEQVLYFRATRGHLVGPGAASVTEAARSIIGAQSQQLNPSLLALSMRTAGRPTATEVQASIFTDSRSLVRSWGQRDTIHVYDAQSHWHHVVAANLLWSPGGRGGPVPNQAALKKALKVVDRLGGIVTRTDILNVAPSAYVKAIGERAALASLDSKRFAAGRLLWRLAQLGHVSIAEKVGAEQSYASRKTWFGSLPWPEVKPENAAVELTRDYLRVYGPATPHDIAHFFGAKITEVRRWVESIASDLTAISCEDRKDLLVRNDDLRDLRRKPASSSSGWPVRMLPLWDSMLMGHADKSWTVPNESERKQVWRKSAMVSSVLLDRGRVVATWTQKTTSKKLKIQIDPLSGWRKSRHLTGAKKEAKAIAAHLELAEAEVAIT